MSESKHTPGPWQANKFAVDGADKFLRIAAMSRCRFVEADGSIHEISDETALANARLIAAAPDLLRVLKDFDHLSLVIESAVRERGQPSTYDSVVSVIKITRAAIAKAAGAEA
jgi:hypothetical protein